MCLSRVKYLLVALFITVGNHLYAQTGTSSNPTNGHENNPYSKYGIGELANGNSTVLKGMGNITSAFENPYELNTDNPASYAFLQRTTFEFGAMGETRNVTGSGLSYRTGTASISYMSLGIPVSKSSGICIGFKPIAHSFYNLADTVFNSPIGEVANNYNGEGSLSYAYLGWGIKYKGFSVGVNAGYLFGTIRNTTADIPIDTNVTNRAYTAQYTNITRIGGIYWKGGVMYETKLDTDYTLRIGGTFSISQNITERLNALQISSYNLGDTLVSDTVSQPGIQSGKLRMPLSYSIGVMLSKNDKWGLGLDFTGTQWSSYNSSPDTLLNSSVGKSSYRISLGGEYTPDINSLRNYWAKVTYRAGLYYGTDYLNIGGTALPFYGATLGASLPFRRSISKLHFALDIGKLGTSTNNLIQQSYVRFSLGISFNDKWFIPRKYD